MSEETSELERSRRALPSHRRRSRARGARRRQHVDQAARARPSRARARRDARQGQRHRSAHDRQRRLPGTLPRRAPAAARARVDERRRDGRLPRALHDRSRRAAAVDRDPPACLSAGAARRPHARGLDLRAHESSRGPAQRGRGTGRRRGARAVPAPGLRALEANGRAGRGARRRARVSRARDLGRPARALVRRHVELDGTCPSLPGRAGAVARPGARARPLRVRRGAAARRPAGTALGGRSPQGAVRRHVPARTRRPAGRRSRGRGPRNAGPPPAHRRAFDRRAQRGRRGRGRRRIRARLPRLLRAASPPPARRLRRCWSRFRASCSCRGSVQSRPGRIRRRLG